MTEVHLTTHDLHFVRQLVERRAAIVLDESKGYLVESRLRPLARTEGFASIADLISRVRLTGGSGRLADAIVEAMTVNETSWFRDARPFELLAADVLPGMIATRSQSRRLRIWSAACSTGQEAYSVGMLIHERFPQISTWDIRIICTDISNEVLERTRSGRYSQLEVNRGLPTPSLVKWFQRDGLEWVVKPELRRMLDVRRMNLAEPWSALPTFDIILIRNVLIYFGNDTKRSILTRAAQQLAADGALLLGASETLVGMDVGLDRVSSARTTYYRPPGAGAVGAAGSAPGGTAAPPFGTAAKRAASL